MRIAINGFGRIGRCVLRAILEPGIKNLEVIAINTPGDEKTCAHLLQYDSIHGKFTFPVEAGQGSIIIEGKKIIVSHERDLTKINWRQYGEEGIDVVLECSGIFNTKEKASQHLQQGAKKVLISAPVIDADCTIVYGVNNKDLKKEYKIISVGSCTTNCLAPVLDVLHKNFEVKNGFMTTIHSYTNDQNIVDNNHKDLRRARACALSMVPTSTGAAKTIGNIIPELKGKIAGVAIRVPTPNVSLIDLKVNVNRVPSAIELVNNAFLQAEQGSLKGVLATCAEPLVSIDFNHNSSSAIIDLNSSYIIDNNFIRVAAWYDNEWGFTCRMLDVLQLLYSPNA